MILFNILIELILNALITARMITRWLIYDFTIRKSHSARFNYLLCVQHLNSLLSVSYKHFNNFYFWSTKFMTVVDSELNKSRFKFVILNLKITSKIDKKTGMVIDNLQKEGKNLKKPSFLNFPDIKTYFLYST